MAIAQGDRAAQEREDAFITGDTMGELDLVSRDARLAASRGQLKQARELFMRASQMAQGLDLKEIAALALADEAGIEADLRYRAEAAKGATAALAISPASQVVYSAARTLALAGEANKAESLMAELAKRRPLDVWAQCVEAPEVQAINEINRGNPVQAVALLQAATPYDRGIWFGVRFTRGNAYLREGNGDKAAEEFQRVLALQNWLWALWKSPLASPLMSLPELGLARAYAAEAGLSRHSETGGVKPPLQPGALVKARAAYQDFFALWKDADPDIPILKEAKAEYAELK
jgi:tetratricopeptide (TPR) repeat protein